MGSNVTGGIEPSGAERRGVIAVCPKAADVAHNDSGTTEYLNFLMLIVVFIASDQFPTNT